MTTPHTSAEDKAKQPRPIRWWPVGVILTLAAGTWFSIWQFPALDHQAQNIQTTKVILATFAALMLWVLLLSRLRWRRRLLLCGSAIAAVGLLAASLEIRGVTGDLVPVLEWRWTKPHSQSLSVEQADPPSDIPLPVASATDYPQFSGPNRNSHVTGLQLARDWKTQPPELLWRQPIGTAWSGFSIVGQYAVTMEQRGESELVACYHLLTGDLIWNHAYQAHYESVIAGEGPRSVPAIVDGRVYALGPSGILNCLDLIDGSVIWSKNIITENESSVPGWGVSCSPLVTEGKVIVSAGGEDGRSLVAYDSQTGDLLWSGGDDRAAYSSPLLATIDDVAQVLIFNKHGVDAHDLETGQVLWTYPWLEGPQNIAMPVVLPDGRVLISTGYGTGSQLIQVAQDSPDNWSTSLIWESKKLKSKFANLIVRDGYIYGLDDGIFVCLDLATGKRQWKRGRYGHGQTILVDDLLLVMDERGEIVLIEPTPERLRELTRFSVLEGKTWNPPALAGEYLLVRNDKEAACYRMPIEQP